ncbi:MAG: hypothetical protein J6W29_06315 [Neisseriaceae bacterium]|nr:hypothetical protein [Neisseriaceae bacterium]
MTTPIQLNRLPRLLTQSRNDTGVSGETANACLSARNDSSFFVWRFYYNFSGSLKILIAHCSLLIAH